MLEPTVEGRKIRLVIAEGAYHGRDLERCFEPTVPEIELVEVHR